MLATINGVNYGYADSCRLHSLHHHQTLVLMNQNLHVLRSCIPQDSLLLLRSPFPSAAPHRPRKRQQIRRRSSLPVPPLLSSSLLLFPSLFRVLTSSQFLACIVKASRNRRPFAAVKNAMSSIAQRYEFVMQVHHTGKAGSSSSSLLKNVARRALVLSILEW